MFSADHSATPPHPLLNQTGLPLNEYRPRNGDHLCSVWTDPGRDHAGASLFLRGGADGGALWVQDPSRHHQQREEDSSGPVVVYSTRDVYLSGGTFDPVRTQRFWQDRAGEAGGDGLRHVRVVAEMAWTLQGRPGTEAAEAYESGLNTVLASLPVSVICQYGSTRFRPDTVLAMLLSHPLVVIGERVFSNPFYRDGKDISPRLDRPRADPFVALLPMWRHFLYRMPGPRDVAALLCNSIPSFIPSASITVHLRGAPRAWRLETDGDVLEEIEPAAVPGHTMSRLFAVWPAGPGTVGGSVHTGSHGVWSWMEGDFDGHASGLVLSRGGGFAREDLMIFTTLASTVASALAGSRHPSTGRLSLA